MPTNTPVSGISGEDRALAELGRRQARAVSSLLFRIVALTVLVAILCKQSPGVRGYRPLLEAMSVVLSLLPFFAAQGYLAAARMTLGQAYAANEAPDAAARVLAPFRGGITARLFDGEGRGRFTLATVENTRGNLELSQRLLAAVAREVGTRSEWGRRAMKNQSVVEDGGRQ